MRMMIGTLLAAALVGCTAQDSLTLDHRAELTAQTRGVELQHDGEESNVGMYETTCDVNTAYAGMGEDYDYTDDEETVVDGEIIDGSETYLVLTPGGVHATTPFASPYSTPFVGTHYGVVAAQLYAEGYVTVTPQAGDCEVALNGADGSANTLLGVQCDEQSSIATNVQTGMTWVSTDSGVFEIAAGQATRISTMPNALLAWDATAEVVYAGVAGRSVVAAIEPGGFERWSTTLDGAITALTDMGERGDAAVSLQTDLGGEFVVVDGETGAIQSDLPTPSAAMDLDVSGNGNVLAITLPDSVFFFDIN